MPCQKENQSNEIETETKLYVNYENLISRPDVVNIATELTKNCRSVQ